MEGETRKEEEGGKGEGGGEREGRRKDSEGSGMEVEKRSMVH